MTKDTASPETLKLGLANLLMSIGEAHQLELEYHGQSPATMLERLISTLYQKTGNQVVVLVDEYDKPILDQIHNLEAANAMRETLYPFYGVLKSSAPYLKLLVVTGITKISQTTIFSGFNNLNDISFDARYAGICGYTQQELEYAFQYYLSATATVQNLSQPEILTAIKYWYDGYSWDSETFVYNPYSVLLLFDKHRFNPFWYTTGTSSYLLKLLKADDNLEIVLQDSIEVPETFTDGQVLENLDPFALMFQAGYLTVKSYNRADGTYQLQLPNQEVREVISDLVLTDVSRTNKTKLHALSKSIAEGFRTGNTALAVESTEILLANRLR